MAKPTKEALDEARRLQGYLDCISKYDREFKKWEDRNKKILKRYRDEGRDTRTDGSSKFNILWSNVQILVPATFARVPQPDVSRRFRDQDPVGRVGALVLERGLEFEVQHYPDYRDTMTQCVHDRFLGGRGTAWIRYEPHFKDSVPPGGDQITEDVEVAEPEEQLDYECAPVDYVHWKDFGHEVCRTWEENTKVWRWVYMSEDAVEERFGEEIAKKIPYDSTPEDLNRSDRNAQSDVKQQAKVCELWDKELGVAVWFSKSMKEFLDEKPDPLKLQQFFPCPKPLYATLTNDSLIPVPDFTLYQDQANALDTLSDRIAGLVNMLQLKGVYDASADAAIGRLFTEGSNGNLLPVKNWAAFAEKNGLKGQIDVYDLTPIAKALEAAYMAAEQIKQQIYEIMGISDIVRGASDPTETLGAQELKGQYASMRLRAMQADVARFATDVLQLKAQVMCSKFNPQTLLAISAAEQLSEQDKMAAFQMQPAPIDPATGKPAGEPKPSVGPDGKPLPGKAIALLVGPERMSNPEEESPNPLRAFRIEVAADSMIQMNEAAEKKDRMEFLTANGAFMDKATQMVAQAGAAAPVIVPLVMEMWKFGVTGFKVGKTIEGQFDEAADKLKQMAMQPQQPRPDPEMAKVEAQKQIDQARLQHDQQEAQMTAQREAQTAEREAALEDRKQQREAAIKSQELQEKYAFERWKVEEETDRAIMVAEISAGAAIDQAQISAAESASGDGEAAPKKPKRESPLKKMAAEQKSHQEAMQGHAQSMAEAHQQLAQSVQQHMERMAQDAQAPVVGRRGPDGRLGSVQKGGKTMRVVRGPEGVSLVPEALQ